MEQPEMPPGASMIPDIFGTTTWRPPSGLTEAQVKDKFRSFPVHQEPPHSCAVNAAMAAAFGFPAGIFMALMFQSPELHSIDQRTDVSLMHKVREGFKMSFRKGWSQGKHDLWNSMVGGWIGGAVIAIRGGPTAVLSSMALMTGFTLAFDVLLGMRGYRPSSIFAAE